jgi:guanylate kinase
MAPAGRLFVISGPGGVGKSTIVEALRTHSSFYFSVSATTRAPRNGEKDGVSYHFIDDGKFSDLVKAGEFLEHAEFAGAHYGTLRQPVFDALQLGKNVILEIEIQGARQVKKAMPDAVMVFIAPPSREDLLRRLEGRGTDDPARIRARLELAEQELAAVGEFDHVLVNHRVDEIVDALVSLAARNQ